MIRRSMTKKRALGDFLLIATLSAATLLVLLGLVNASIAEDKQALLDFLRNISHHSHNISWNRASSVCDHWTGITCDAGHTRVVGIHLPGVGLRGPIPPRTLARLSSLEVLSLGTNRISGSFPSDFVKLVNLTSIYLQSNNFSGPLPSDFSVWKNLTTVDLSSNGFNGTIPPSLANLTNLAYLNLSRNLLSGAIPDLNNPSLIELDLADNRLTGIVPRSLWRFPGSVFLGNNLTASNAIPPSLPVEPPYSPVYPARKANHKLSEPALLAIALGGCVFAFLTIVLLMFVHRSKRAVEQSRAGGKQHKKESSSKNKDISESQDKTNRLSFFEGCNLAFDLEDLLRASAEVLGKGTFGTTYKAAMEDATTTPLAVKRLKEVTVPRREFELQMEIVGNIKHEHVVPLRAYYYSKDEKLIVSDYLEQGNVSAMLHGRRGQGRVPLDWETRLRIAIGAARGIAFIHTQNGGRLVHGNIKASNIFLNPRGYGCVSDTALAALMNPMPPPVIRAAGYRAPEVTDTRKATPASDVYSFGVLLLELLTGKSPVHATGTEEVVHLVRWVTSVVREEWTAEVFDIELLRYPDIEEEMVEMLQLGMSCVAKMPEKRPNITAVLTSLEEIRQFPGAGGNRPSSDIKSEITSPNPNT